MAASTGRAPSACCTSSPLPLRRGGRRRAVRSTGEQSCPGNRTSAKISLRELSAMLTIPCVLCCTRILSAWRARMFDLEQFTADCHAALKADSSHKLVREVVARAVSDPAGVLKGLGEPKRAEVQKLYHAPDLTILNVIWAPMM